MAATFSIFSQPLDGAFGDKLFDQMGSGKYARINFVVAYAKLSGVARLAPHLESFHASGGSSLAIIGVDQKSTSYEAVELLHTLGVETWIYHDEDNSKTFHPKVYRLLGPHHSWIAVGSNNLTAGGLYSNYETSVIVSGDSKTTGSSLSNLVDAYSDPKSLCAVHVGVKQLADLKLNGYLPSEAEIAAFKAASAAVMGSPSTTKKKMFATGKLGKKPPPILAKFKPKSTGAGSAPIAPFIGAAATSAPPAGAPTAGVSVKPGFWKRLSGWDTSPTSSPGQIQIPIGFLPFFPPLTAKKGMPSGGTQSDVSFDVAFAKGAATPKLVPGARVILYEPAPAHLRQNKELRFTFHNKPVFNQLSKGDILEFRLTGLSSPHFVIRRWPHKHFAGRFGPLPATI